MPPLRRLIANAAAFDIRAQCPGVTSRGVSLAVAWQRWRGEKLRPRRAEIVLGDIKPLLPMVSLLEIRSADEIIFRVVGSQIRDYLGVDITGRNYLDLAPAADRARRAWRMAQQASVPCGSYFLYPHRFPSGRTEPAETVSLPITADRPEGAPLVLTVSTPLSAHQEEAPAATGPQIPVVDQFAFIDIGAGVPDRIEP